MNRGQRRVLSTALLMLGVVASLTFILMFVFDAHVSDAAVLKTLCVAFGAITGGLYVRAGGGPASN
ncbi:MAG: hypothetical protein E6J75_17810 [Deltaproteobacteria bacterium]|nr:MAG: hypothetical protein E6J75_17810 [Deltaproteobacteria bacterium]